MKTGLISEITNG